MTNTHSTHVETTATGYQAVCACGWSGPVEDLRRNAHGDAGDHILAHFVPSPAPTTLPL